MMVSKTFRTSKCTTNFATGKIECQDKFESVEQLFKHVNTSHIPTEIDVAPVNELRNAGFLRLPSGRTLSDYKNFCSAKSGWQLSVLNGMRSSYNEQKLPEVGKLGALIFDEVKIKGGGGYYLIHLHGR